MVSQELHIAFDQIYDKINSSVVQSVSKADKDWWLNKAQIELLKPSLILEQVGRYSSQRRIDLQQQLIRRKVLTAFTHNDALRQYVILPSDYLLLESDASNIVYNCNGVGSQKGASDTNTKVAYMPFPTATTAPYYTGFNIWLDSDSPIYNIADTLTSISDIGLKYLVINDCFDNLKDNSVDDLEVYWERYGEVYKPNNLIFVSTATSPPTSVSWGYSLAVAQETISFESLNLLKRADVTTKLDLFETNRMMPNDRLHELLNHDFGKTSYKSPISSIRNGLIEVYTNTTFNITSVEIEYTRVPKKINYLVEQGSELNANYHPELVLLAAELASDSILNGQKGSLFKPNLITN